jgi:hypothetical protein
LQCTSASSTFQVLSRNELLMLNIQKPQQRKRTDGNCQQSFSAVAILPSDLIVDLPRAFSVQLVEIRVAVFLNFRMMAKLQ